jgi:N-acetylglucosaminyl-diphospho-decaprenol L-rhamnosyltransferase
MEAQEPFAHTRMSDTSDLSDVSVIVVHHNSPVTLGPTLEALVLNGLPTSSILIVDNSSTVHSQERAEAVAGARHSILHVPNRGYAAAVNEGLRHLKAQDALSEYTLITTHEALPTKGATRQLRLALEADESIAVAGPTLIDGASDVGAIWSVGGVLTSGLHLPRHLRRVDPTNNAEPAIDREWLDGAFTMYRTEYIANDGLDEAFFLYFEETDLHTRLRRRGMRVVWVPKAVVSQLSSGIPPVLLGRNLFLFHSKHYSRASGRVAVSYEVLRASARFLLRRRGTLLAPIAILRGWKSGESFVRKARRQRRHIGGGD